MESRAGPIATSLNMGSVGLTANGREQADRSLRARPAAYRRHIGFPGRCEWRADTRNEKLRDVYDGSPADGPGARQRSLGNRLRRRSNPHLGAEKPSRRGWMRLGSDVFREGNGRKPQLPLTRTAYIYFTTRRETGQLANTLVNPRSDRSYDVTASSPGAEGTSRGGEDTGR